jgi:hypothetical protein
MKNFNRNTMLTLIGAFIIAGLCVSGSNSISKEGLNSKISSDNYLGNDTKSYGGILELKALEKRYKLLMGELISQTNSNPILKPESIITPSTSSTSKPISAELDKIAKMMNGGKTSNCTDPSKCGIVKSPELGTMGNTIKSTSVDPNEEYSTYHANIREIQGKLSSIRDQMAQIVIADNFKERAGDNLNDSKKTLHTISEQNKEISKWVKKVNNMESDIARASADLENSKLENKSNYYFYITWIILVIILGGVAFNILHQPIFSVISILIIIMLSGFYLFRQYNA